MNHKNHTAFRKRCFLSINKNGKRVPKEREKVRKKSRSSKLKTEIQETEAELKSNI